MTTRVSVVEEIMSANDRLAAAVRAQLAASKVFALNVMASPGAGKTSLITRTVEALRDEWRIGAVDGDIATTIDADRVAALRPCRADQHRRRLSPGRGNAPERIATDTTGDPRSAHH